MYVSDPDFYVQICCVCLASIFNKLSRPGSKGYLKREPPMDASKILIMHRQRSAKSHMGMRAVENEIASCYGNRKIE